MSMLALRLGVLVSCIAVAGCPRVALDPSGLSTPDGAVEDTARSVGDAFVGSADSGAAPMDSGRVGVDAAPRHVGARVLLHKDSDLDGYGDPAGRVAMGWPIEGWSPIATDCDDSCAVCHPGGVEVCDAAGRDEDCSGLANDHCE